MQRALSDSKINNKQIGIVGMRYVGSCFMIIVLGFNAYDVTLAHTRSARVTDATQKGFYLGLNVGYSSIDYHRETFDIYRPISIHASGLSPKVSFGYEINRYLGVELAVIYLNKPYFTFDGDLNGTHKIKQNVVYLVGKFSLPIKKFSLYVKCGYGYVVRDAVIIQYTHQTTVLRSGEFSTFVGGGRAELSL